MFSDAFKKANAHEQMVRDLDTTPYEMSVPDLQKKVVEFIESTSLNGKWVYVSNPQTNRREKLMAVEEKMNDGFTYKDKLYVTAWSPDMSLFSGDMEKIKKNILKSTYHVIESSENEFLIVKGNNIFEAKKVDSIKTLLKVYQLTAVVTPLSVGLDWWNLVKGKGLFPTFETLPVDLNASRKYQEEDKVSKLSLYFFIDKERAEKKEAELLAAQPS